MRKRIFWLLRTNLKTLEKYHSVKDLSTFEKECHDFYLLFPMQFLKNDFFDEVIIWRLSDDKIEDIVFEINNKKFIQRWVKNFTELFSFSNPDITFFRGGFPEYCEITKINPKFFGKKIYLGSSKRVTPQYGGIYDKILVESEEDLRNIKNSSIFLKTANQNIFKPLDIPKTYDLLWIANFTQIRHKGQEFFIDKISKSDFFKSLKIVHIGNKQEIGLEMTNKNNVNNIEFIGHNDRKVINEYLNMSKFGIVTSNEIDGCPRVSTEILCSGTPLLIRDKTRLPNYNFKHNPVIYFNDNNIEEVVFGSLTNYKELQKNSLVSLDILSLDNISELNYIIWGK